MIDVMVEVIGGFLTDVLMAVGSRVARRLSWPRRRCR